MRLWIIDDSNKTASAMLEPEEVEALANAISYEMEHLDNPASAVQNLKNLALKLEKLGLKIEGL